MKLSSQEVPSISTGQKPSGWSGFCGIFSLRCGGRESYFRKCPIGLKKWPIGKVTEMTSLDLHTLQESLVPYGFYGLVPETIAFLMLPDPSGWSGGPDAFLSFTFHWR